TSRDETRILRVASADRGRRALQPPVLSGPAYPSSRDIRSGIADRPGDDSRPETAKAACRPASTKRWDRPDQSDLFRRWVGGRPGPNDPDVSRGNHKNGPHRR